MSISDISTASHRFTNQNPMEFELDVIRSGRRGNSLSLYNFKQYHTNCRHNMKDNVDKSAICRDRKTESFDRQFPKGPTNRKILSQILPNKIVIDKKDEEIRVDNVSTIMANQRRASDTYSPYGTRSFPSLRQRPPSTDSNLSMSTNSLDFSTNKSGYDMANGNVDRNSSSTGVSEARKISANYNKQTPITHHRISLTAPRQPPYLYHSKAKLL